MKLFDTAGFADPDGFDQENQQQIYAKAKEIGVSAMMICCSNSALDQVVQGAFKLSFALYGELSFNQRTIFVVTKQRIDPQALEMWEDNNKYSCEELDPNIENFGLEVKRK